MLHQFNFFLFFKNLSKEFESSRYSNSYRSNDSIINSRPTIALLCSEWMRFLSSVCPQYTVTDDTLARNMYGKNTENSTKLFKRFTIECAAPVLIFQIKPSQINKMEDVSGSDWLF